MANRYEISTASIVVDIRPWGTRMAEALAQPEMMAIWGGMALVVGFMVPILLVIMVPIFLIMYIASGKVAASLPVRYPPGSVNPENKKKGDGILYLGGVHVEKSKEDRMATEDIADKFQETWFADDDLRKHAFVLGSTGSGKSELLKGVFWCGLCWGSGFFVADGKADNKLPLDNYNMARYFGRDDDLLTLNFLLGSKTPEEVRNSRRRHTNKLNPFSRAGDDTIVQMGSNLLPKAEGESKAWQEKCLNFWRSLVPALVWIRDNEGLNLTVSVFIDYLPLNKVEELYAKGAKLALDNNGVWPDAFAGIKSYIEGGIPGYRIERLLRKFQLAPARPMAPGSKPEPLEQESTIYDQHGYRASQLAPAMNLLDKTYGHIFRDRFSEIDMADATLNNRILVMLIPSLEKSAAEAENLGKLTVACLRVMMGKNLGADLEGSREALIESKATEANYPYIVALDELGYYFADGLAVMFAQARSLGFFMIAAAQDIEKLTEGGRAPEAGAMIANTMAKIFMRNADAQKTNDMIQKYLGEVTLALRKDYEWREGFGFARSKEIRVEKVQAVTMKNLSVLGPGKAVLSTLGKTVKIASLFVGDFLAKYPTQDFHINRFLQVRPMTQGEVEANSLPIDALSDKIVKGEKLRLLVTGELGLPDLRALADERPYSARHELALDVVNAVAAAVERLPANVVGAKRAAYLYIAAKKAMLAARGAGGGSGIGSSGGAADVGQRPGDQVFSGGPEESYVTPGQALGGVGASRTGEQITDGSGSGVVPRSETNAQEVDPFAFLNEAKPLQRKPLASVLAADAADASAIVAAASEASRLLSKTGAAGATEAQASPPAAFDALLGQVIDAGEPVLFEGEGATPRQDERARPAALAERAPLDRSSGVNDNVQAAAQSSQWIGRALAEAGIALKTKGDTVVGFTAEAKASLEAVEALLGNDQPGQASAAVEQLVAQQATPSIIPETGADFDDIDSILAQIEQNAP